MTQSFAARGIDWHLNRGRECHRHRYTAEIDFRYNTGQENDRVRADLNRKAIGGQRHTWQTDKLAATLLFGSAWHRSAASAALTNKPADGRAGLSGETPTGVHVLRRVSGQAQNAERKMWFLRKEGRPGPRQPPFVTSRNAACVAGLFLNSN